MAEERVENKEAQANEIDELIKLTQSKSRKAWQGTCAEYLKKVKENPEIACSAPSRVYKMIMSEGTKDIDRDLKIKGYDDLVSYNFFEEKGRIYGSYWAIHDLVSFLKAASRKTETSKRILVLVGPVASGKSTIVYWLKRGLEQFDLPVYRIQGCPLNEDPLNLIPFEQREDWSKALGVSINGSLCPSCQRMLDEKFTDSEGHIAWDQVPVEQFFLSERRRVGIGTFLPSDPKSQDVSELVGRVNLSKMARYGETDPRAFEFNGEIEVSNRGLMEYIELLKADVRFHYILITVAQEQMLKVPGFPQIFIDCLVVGHTNQTEYERFKSAKENEALHDRMYVVQVPWNLRVDDEIKIYDKMIRESEFKDIHIAPHTLKVAAQYAVLSRLKESPLVPSLITKMKLYNGDTIPLTDSKEYNIREIFQESRQLGEGMTGISPRFIINAINIALGTKEHKRCVNPVDIIRSLSSHFDHHVGFTDDDRNKFMLLLSGEKDSILSEYKEIAKKEVNLAFLHAYEEQAQSLFDNYMINVTAYCCNEKVTDSVTGELLEPDDKLMRDIEEVIGIPKSSVKEFRQSIFVYKSRCLEKGEPFTFRSYSVLRDGIEKKLMSVLEDVVNLTLTDKASIGEKTKKKRNEVIERLKERGYCDECASVLLSFVGEILRKES